MCLAVGDEEVGVGGAGSILASCETRWDKGAAPRRRRRTAARATRCPAVAVRHDDLGPTLLARGLQDEDCSPRGAWRCPFGDVRADGRAAVRNIFVVRGGRAHGAVRAVGVVGGSRGAGSDRERVGGIRRGSGCGGGRRGPAGGGGRACPGRGGGGRDRDVGDGVRGRGARFDRDGSRGGGLASGADDRAGPRGAGVRALGGFSDGAARRGAADRRGRVALLQFWRRDGASERAAAGERGRGACDGERCGAWTTRATREDP